MFSCCPVICACVRVYVCVWPACRRRLVQSLMNCGCDVHRVTKTSTFLFFEQLCQKLTDFGTLNPENISHENLTGLSTSSVRCSYFTLGNPKKVIFMGIIYTYTSDYLCCLWKQTVIHLPTPPENVTTQTCELQNFLIWLKYCCVLSSIAGSEDSQLLVVISGSEKNRLWCVATGMSGKQCYSKCSEWPPCALIHASSFFSTLISRTAHHAVLKFSPCRNKPLPQASTSPYQYMWSSCSLLQMLY